MLKQFTVLSAENKIDSDAIRQLLWRQLTQNLKEQSRSTSSCGDGFTAAIDSHQSVPPSQQSTRRPLTTEDASPARKEIETQLSSKPGRSSECTPTTERLSGYLNRSLSRTYHEGLPRIPRFSLCYRLLPKKGEKNHWSKSQRLSTDSRSSACDRRECAKVSL